MCLNPVTPVAVACTLPQQDSFVYVAVVLLSLARLFWVAHRCLRLPRESCSVAFMALSCHCAQALESGKSWVQFHVYDS